MKNTPLYALAATLIIIFSLMAYGFYAYITGPDYEPQKLSLFCTAIFIIFAFLAFEMLFKGGLLFGHRLLPPEEE